MATPYFLAIDVGTSRTAAATARSTPDGALLAAPLPLGRNADSTPTTVFVSDSGLLFGEAAERRGTAQPERLVREFKRRIGDDVPIVAGDRRFSPQDLFALIVGWVIGTAVEREGQHPEGIAVSVPVTWGEYRTQLVRDAIGRLGWNDVQVITEPEAAARHYESTHPLDIGRALAVYDFGGGTFDTVILQKTVDGHVDFVGSPVGIPDLGGADFDDMVLRHTVRAAGIPASALAGVHTDPGMRMALASLRRECVDAKESLSFDGEAVVPVLIGDGHGAVRLTRAEFEDMIEPEIARTVEVLEIALEQSGLTADDLDAILLTGGTSRIPRVAQLLSERFDRPIAVDADPKAIIALGAARTAAGGGLQTFPVADVDDDAPDDDDHGDPTADDGFTADRAAKRAPWFRRVPATAYVAAGVAVLTVTVGVVSVPALGVGILARTGMAVTSQPLAADLDVRLFDPIDMPSSPPASIAAPAVEPAAAQPVAPQEAAAPEESRATTRGEERPRTPQRLTPQTAEQRSPSASPPASQQASGGGGGGTGGSSDSAATQPSSPTSTEPSASTGTPSTAPTTDSPAPVDPSPTTAPPVTEEPQPTPSTENPQPTPSTENPQPSPSTENPPPSEQPAETTAPVTETPPAAEPTP
ncbi:Hsp70 family protein [Microbacterium sp. VKM Ac-2923]|uniref:Hsp70 family protein n=1 Tax=Microbacterium sp. VKM Ac-2923 TaxID=2929476 RepID=UPI001FB1F53E|nr:Hsp70 family protein [Microbacterium sp. VKM Ac-2923]MCJ1706453.1 Hsp70 family protein [Microbacterium sp. VKM Ac-2923]